MSEEELKLLIHLLLMCGVMDKKALENGVITNDEIFVVLAEQI